EAQRPQILAAPFEDIIEPDPGGVIGDHLRRRDFAIEPLLQIVERRDRTVAHHQQLSVKNDILVLQREEIGKRRANIVAAARIKPALAAAADELYADAVPFPLRAIINRIELGDI